MLKLSKLLPFLCLVSGDVRFASKVGNGFKILQKDVPPNTDVNGNPITEGEGKLPYQVPSTFGYKALENEKENNNDQFLRSNIDNPTLL